eukprot:365471-Chlamydomonas_euryale.AAC.4
MEAQALGLTAPPVASTSGERSDSPKGFPLRTRIYRKDCGGTATDFSLTAYADATLLFVTQTGTAGTVFRAARDGAADGGSATYTTQVRRQGNSCAASAASTLPSSNVCLHRNLPQKCVACGRLCQKAREPTCMPTLLAAGHRSGAAGHTGQHAAHSVRAADRGTGGRQGACQAHDHRARAEAT